MLGDALEDLEHLYTWNWSRKNQWPAQHVRDYMQGPQLLLLDRLANNTSL